MKQKGLDRNKKSWPTKDAMDQVYAMNLWGGQQSDFYSGAGSHLPELVNPYIDVVGRFLSSFNSPLTVCDLGCGDFNVGNQLVHHTKKYIAVDIVNELIERNRKQFAEENLEFNCMDIAVDKLPSADCAILRQVLQHLSNAEVQRIAKKLIQYKYLIVTEHVPNCAFIPNKDIISGQGIRLKKQSGLVLTEPPFNLNPLQERQLLSVELNHGKGAIETTLYILS